MVAITQTTQLSIFSLIKSALLNNSTLSTKFNSTNIIQYEPKHKSSNFIGFPYIWVNVPTTDDTILVLGDDLRLKDLSIELYLRMEYLAKDNYLNYANSIIRAIESYKSNFKSSGYHRVGIELINTDPNQVIQQKEIIEGIFNLTADGSVVR